MKRYLLSPIPALGLIAIGLTMSGAVAAQGPPQSPVECVLDVGHSDVDVGDVGTVDFMDVMSNWRTACAGGDVVSVEGRPACLGTPIGLSGTGPDADQQTMPHATRVILLFSSCQEVRGPAASTRPA